MPCLRAEPHWPQLTLFPLAHHLFLQLQHRMAAATDKQPHAGNGTTAWPSLPITDHCIALHINAPGTGYLSSHLRSLGYEKALSFIYKSLQAAEAA